MSILPRLTTAALLLALGVPVASAQTVPWRRWDAGLKEAEARHRFVLVDVYTQWCGWCKKMDREVYARPDVREYLQGAFVTIKLDAESRDAATFAGRATNERAIAQHFDVSGYPTTIFMRDNGEHLANVPGYLPADRFLLLLRYIGDGHMDRGVKWETWVAQQGGTN